MLIFPQKAEEITKTGRRPSGWSPSWLHTQRQLRLGIPEIHNVTHKTVTINPISIISMPIWTHQILFLIFPCLGTCREPWNWRPRMSVSTILRIAANANKVSWVGLTVLGWKYTAEHKASAQAGSMLWLRLASRHVLLNKSGTSSRRHNNHPSHSVIVLHINSFKNCPNWVSRCVVEVCGSFIATSSSRLRPDFAPSSCLSRMPKNHLELGLSHTNQFGIRKTKVDNTVSCHFASESFPTFQKF